MKDIGSIFPLYEEDLKDNSYSLSQVNDDGLIRYSLCREALWEIAKKYNQRKRVALLPAYTCQTVIDPFIQQGWGCCFYNIDKTLRIDIGHLERMAEEKKPTIILTHPYYGMELSNAELQCMKFLKKKGHILIEDLTQCILTEHRPEVFDYFVGSYRKWEKIPDGGFLESLRGSDIEKPKMENHSFVEKQKDAMYLRGVYFLSGNQSVKDISIRLNKEATRNVNMIKESHLMSKFSSYIWDKTDTRKLGQIRMNNYKFLYENIKFSKNIKKVCSNLQNVTTPPLYFPIYVNNRADLQSYLAKHKIYAPVLWPVSTDKVLINSDIEYIYDSILLIPIDQRYDEEDMKKIVNVIYAYEYE